MNPLIVPKCSKKSPFLSHVVIMESCFCVINDPRKCPRPKFWLLGQLKLFVLADETFTMFSSFLQNTGAEDRKQMFDNGVL